MRGTWEDPPESAERERKWDATFDELKQNPEKWAKLFVGKDRNAHSLGGRLRKLYPGYEIMTRTVKKKKNVKQAGVWARYTEEEAEIHVQHMGSVFDNGTGTRGGLPPQAETWNDLTDGDPHDHGGSASLDG